MPVARGSLKGKMPQGGFETERPKAVCFTGHRPAGLPWGDNKEDARCREFLRELADAIDRSIEQGFRRFICGNALGVDTWAAEIVLTRKEAHPDITLEIALPFEGHNREEPSCRAVMERADLVHVVSRARSRREAFFERNRYMVDHSSRLIAAHDVLRGWTGGAGMTYRDALARGLEVVTIPYNAPCGTPPHA